MKRLVIAIVMVVVVIVGCFLSIRKHNNVFENLQSDIENIEEKYTAGNFEACKVDIDKLVSDFTEHKKYMQYFITQTEIALLEVEIIQMSHLSYDETFFTKIQTVKYLIGNLAVKDKPYIHNIL